MTDRITVRRPSVDEIDVLMDAIGRFIPRERWQEVAGPLALRWLGEVRQQVSA